MPEEEGERDERVEALDSRECPKCGGNAEWSPREQSLVCPYCETVLDARDGGGESDGAVGSGDVVRELDLRHALANIEEATEGKASGERKVHCQNCDADSLVSSERVSDRCQFCGSPNIVGYDSIDSVIRPESLLPKKITKDEAYGKLKAWLGNKFWAPGDLKSKNLVEEMKGVYIPYWTFDAHAECPWKATSGDYYYVTERYTDAQGNRKSRRVRKTRWYPSSGHVAIQFDDVLVPATKLVRGDFLRQVEPFPTKELVAYDTVYVSGWQVEHYSVTLQDGAKQGRDLMHAALRSKAGSEVPGDTYRGLSIYPEYSGETFKHVLVPVWVLLYQYRGKIFQSVVNGYTGETAGEYPKSGWKIFFAVLIGVLVIGGIALAVGMSK